MRSGLRIEQQVEQIFRRDALADGPVAHAVPVALALDPLVADLVVRMQPGERVEFERQARMAGAHDPVRDHAFLLAHVARQAQLGALDRIVGRIHALGDIVGMRDAAVGMRVEPQLGAAVAGFAADAVGNLETLAAPVGGLVVVVAIETDLGLGRIAEAELVR